MRPAALVLALVSGSCHSARVRRIEKLMHAESDEKRQHSQMAWNSSRAPDDLERAQLLEEDDLRDQLTVLAMLLLPHRTPAAAWEVYGLAARNPAGNNPFDTHWQPRFLKRSAHSIDVSMAFLNYSDDFSPDAAGSNASWLPSASDRAAPDAKAVESVSFSSGAPESESSESWLQSETANLVRYLPDFLQDGHLFEHWEDEDFDEVNDTSDFSPEEVDAEDDDLESMINRMSEKQKHTTALREKREWRRSNEQRTRTRKLKRIKKKKTKAKEKAQVYGFDDNENRKKVEQAENSDYERVVGILKNDIPKLLERDPHWQIFSDNFKVIDQKGVELKGLSTSKRLLMFLRRLYSKYGTRQSITINYITDREDLEDPFESFLVARWKIQLSRISGRPWVPSWMPFLGQKDIPVDIEAVTAFHVNEVNLIDYVQVEKWKFAGRQIQLWPNIELCGNPEGQELKFRKWAKSTTRIQPLSLTAQELRAQKFEESRKAKPWKLLPPKTSAWKWFQNSPRAAVVNYMVVDFGSGYTRANLVRLYPDGSATTERLKTLHGIALQKALGSPELVEQLVLQIAKAVPVGSILAGATGGVRFAVDTGAVTNEQLDDFKEVFTTKLGERAKFNVLSIEQEARCEWMSVEYALRSMENMKDPGVPKLADVRGIMTCGGITCQIAYRDDQASSSDDDLCFASYHNLVGLMEDWTSIKRPSSNLLKGYYLRAYEKQVQQNVAATNVTGLKGVYILTELWNILSFKQVDGPGIMPYQVMPVLEVQSRIDEWLQRELDSPAPITGRKTALVLMATLWRVVFQQVFDRSAQVCFMGGKDLSWSFGWALEAEKEKVARKKAEEARQKAEEEARQKARKEARRKANWAIRK